MFKRKEKAGDRNSFQPNLHPQSRAMEYLYIALLVAVAIAVAVRYLL